MQTICANSTNIGGAICVIRVSGDNAINITNQLFRSSKNKELSQMAGYSAHFGRIVESDESIVDEVIVIVYKAPHSYTGEDATEIMCHASVYIVHRILELLMKQGCRIARPGEFTERAFMNRKMDLSQAEAVADLIAASNEATHRLAMSQMRGDFSHELKNLRNKLLEITSLLELEIDFSEEDIEFADRKQLIDLANNIHQVIQNLINTFRTGNAIKNGIPVAIIGHTNTGKSTLLNRLLHDDRAIVSDIHGTTRDTIEDTIDINGMYLSDDIDNRTKYRIRADAVSTLIPPHGHLIVGADQLDPLRQLHAGFKLANRDGECVILTAGDLSWSDTLRYVPHTGEESVGRYPDGGKRVFRMTRPTPAAANQLTTYATWLYGNDTDFDPSSVEGIATTTAGRSPVAETHWYSPSGLRLTAPQRGINIVKPAICVASETTTPMKPISLRSRVVVSSAFTLYRCRKTL